MTTELVRTEHTIPAPALAGWTEESRLLEIARFRENVRLNGGTIVAERRTRNVAFDERGERTTFFFRVQWSALVPNVL